MSDLSEGLFRDFFEFHQWLRLGHRDYSFTKILPCKKNFPKKVEELLAKMPVDAGQWKKISDDHMVSGICRPEENIGPFHGCKG